MAATADGKGYWLVAADGGVFAYGDAPFHGSAGDITLNAARRRHRRHPGGGGYWLVGPDGGVFAYGDATFHGSLGGTALAAPVVGHRGDRRRRRLLARRPATAPSSTRATPASTATWPASR